LKKIGGVRTPVRLGEPSHSVIALIDPEATKLALDNVIQVEGLDLLLHTTLIGASRVENNIQSVTLFDDSGPHKVEGRFFIDASGEGDLAAFGGASIRYGNHGKVQQGTLAVRFGGIKPGSDISAERWAEAIQQAEQSGNLSPDEKKRLEEQAAEKGLHALFKVRLFLSRVLAALVEHLFTW